ncbi:chorismate mutase [Phyllobacterium salinisoli]|uniref:Chorismate mutase n=1 Tax=Phyllobacterium salinisoli TaxID=1899321 RepID=A0A368K2Z5_9HYPH|nr:chorismate mutase [Phyllobacterium salinisoli]RCS22995.1 chorismate mutase [Phyllobacterium salinisoli]
MRTRPGKRIVWWSILLMGVVLAPMPSRAGTAPDALAPLIDAISQRLSIADQVAQSKWGTHAAVEDVKREQAVLNAVSAQASRFKLDPDGVKSFFSAQIEANKIVQYGLLWQWVEAGKAPSGASPDLKNIRIQLDQLQDVLLENLAGFGSYRSDARCNQWVASAIAQAPLDDLHRWALVRATGGLCAVKPE